MPFKSRRQQRKCYAMKARGAAGSWDCSEWSEHTNFKKLPEKAAQQPGITTRLPAVDENDLPWSGFRPYGGFPSSAAQQSQPPVSELSAPQGMQNLELPPEIMEQITGQGISPWLTGALGAGGAGAIGAGLGGLGGAMMGAGRGNTAEGLGRGVIRGGATGAGAALGGMGGQAIGNAMGYGNHPLATLLGALTGGGLGYLGSGALMGDPVGEGDMKFGSAEKPANANCNASSSMSSQSGFGVRKAPSMSATAGAGGVGSMMAKFASLSLTGKYKILSHPRVPLDIKRAFVQHMLPAEKQSMLVTIKQAQARSAA